MAEADAAGEEWVGHAAAGMQQSRTNWLLLCVYVDNMQSHSLWIQGQCIEGMVT